MRFGIVGLGRMGSGIARRAIAAGHQCVGFDTNPALVAELEAAGAEGASTAAALVEALTPPRFVWVMVPVSVTGSVVAELAELLSPDDVLIDGGNSNFRDSIDRAKKLESRGVEFADIGTSGGVFGEERGFCLMVGGSESVFQTLQPLLRSLAPGVGAAMRSPKSAGDPTPAEEGYLHCGPAGAGHFAKMIHNGIEYGMMASLAEGVNLLERAKDGPQPYDRFDFDLPELTELWRRGSVISSWLLDLTAAAVAEDPALEEFTGHVSDSGEGRWTAQAAIDLAVPAHTLTAALFDRFASRGGAETANKLLSAMRAQFGGHEETKADE